MYLALAKPINTLVINRRGRRFKSCRIDSWQGARRPVDVCSAQTVTECGCRKVWKYRLSGTFLVLQEKCRAVIFPAKTFCSKVCH